MKNFLTTIAFAAAMALPMAAQAATCDEGLCAVSGADGQALTSGVLFQLTEIENDAITGSFNFVGNFFNNTNDDANASITVLQFAPTTSGSIANLVMTVFFPAIASQSFAITDAVGAAINPTGNDVVARLNLQGVSNQLIGFELQGEAIVGANGTNPNLNVFISAVPLPAAGGLLLATMVAGGFVGRRRKDKKS